MKSSAVPAAAVRVLRRLRGCGETPYIKLVTQLFGDRLIVANATGCSSIFGGNLPTTPYTIDRDGRGPAWANSLFEDNAEFGLGHAARRRSAPPNARAAAADVREDWCPTASWRRFCRDDSRHEAGIHAQRRDVALLQQTPAPRRPCRTRAARRLADYLVKKSVWIVGGDGWAYDIGYGGLDHVLASGAERQRARSRHRGVFQHGRTAVKGDADAARGEVRSRRARRVRRRTSASWRWRMAMSMSPRLPWVRKTRRR